MPNKTLNANLPPKGNVSDLRQRLARSTKNLIHSYNRRNHTKYTTFAQLPLSTTTWLRLLKKMASTYVPTGESQDVTKARKVTLAANFAGERSESIAKRFYSYTIFCLIVDDLNLPVEEMIYGSTNVGQIADFNYRYYDQLDIVQRCYLSQQMKATDHLSKMLHERVLPYMSLRQLSEYMDGEISHSALHMLLDSPAGYKRINLPKERTVIEKIAGSINADPIEFIAVPNRVPGTE